MAKPQTRGANYPLDPLNTGVRVHKFGGEPKKSWWRRNKDNETADYFVEDFHLVWERKPLPDPGTGVYAFETYGLPQFPVAGPSIANRDQIRSYAAPLYKPVQLVTLQGLPTVAGQVIAAPLYDPSQGFVRGLAPSISSPAPNAVRNI